MAEAKNNQTPDVSEQDKIRRGKLADLQAAGLMAKKPVKILANGELTKKIEVEANAFSEAAKQAIEALGGTITKI